MVRKWIYLISRVDKKTGLKETIWAYQPCKGWSIIRKTEYKPVTTGLVG